MLKFKKMFNNLEDAFNELRKLSFSFEDMIQKINSLRIDKMNEEWEKTQKCIVPMSIQDVFSCAPTLLPCLNLMYRTILNINPVAEIEFKSAQDVGEKLIYTTFSGKNRWVFECENHNSPSVFVTWECESKNGTAKDNILKHNDNHNLSKWIIIKE